MVILTLIRIIAKIGSPSDLYQKMAEAKAASVKRVSFTFAAFRPEILLRRQLAVSGFSKQFSINRHLMAYLSSGLKTCNEPRHFY